MKSRLANSWQKLRTSLWFVPLLMMTCAGLAALVTTTVDRHVPKLRGYRWLWWGEPSGARDILTTIASSMITVAGVSFSITIVAMTLAASQFGPRLLRNFMRDTGNQVVLGTFVSTFLYCLLVLGSVADNGPTAVPQLSISVALVLAVASLIVLIYFVHHVSTSLQSEDLAATTAAEMREVIHVLFPEQLGHPAEMPPPDSLKERLARLEFRPVEAPKSGYLQSLDADRLLDLAESNDLVLSLPVAPGDFIVKGSALARISPPERYSDKLASELASMFVLGRHRTPTQDAKYPLRQLTVIAVRALSPGINDPFTALTCIDWIGSGLSQLTQREIPTAYRKGPGGQVRVIAEPTTFSALADVALNPIRQSGAGHIAVMLRLLETIDSVAQHARRGEDRRSLQDHADRVLEEVTASNHRPRDKETVRRLHRTVTRNLWRRRMPPEERGATPPSDRG